MNKREGILRDFMDNTFIYNRFILPSHDPLQCPKLGVHPAPGAHISTAGCTIYGGVHPVCARFLSFLLSLYIRRVHGAISGCTVLGAMHPVSAQNESLISDTAP